MHKASWESCQQSLIYYSNTGGVNNANITSTYKKNCQQILILYKI